MNSLQTNNGQHLVLIPTSLELSLAHVHLEKLKESSQVQVELCGLGLIEAGIAAMRFFQRVQPSCVWHLGIAGSYNHRLRLSEAYEFSRLACYGVGVGEGENFQSASQLGWSKTMGVVTGEILQLNSGSPDRLLISVPSASANEREVALKMRIFPEAVAEDMESYAVAVACKAQGIPLRVIRGISNQAGDRDMSRWQAAAAMQATVALTADLIRTTICHS